MNNDADKLFLAIEAKIGQSVYPCFGKTKKQCVTVEFGKTYVWFNTADKSTHMLDVDTL